MQATYQRIGVYLKYAHCWGYWEILWQSYKYAHLQRNNHAKPKIMNKKKTYIKY